MWTFHLLPAVGGVACVSDVILKLRVRLCRAAVSADDVDESY